jgi:hypothetical protein
MARQPIEWPPGRAIACRNCSNISVFLFISECGPAHPRAMPSRVQDRISAKKQHLLRNRFGFYVRNGPIWRRQYSYCQ